MVQYCVEEVALTPILFISFHNTKRGISLNWPLSCAAGALRRGRPWRSAVVSGEIVTIVTGAWTPLTPHHMLRSQQHKPGIFSPFLARNSQCFLQAQEVCGGLLDIGRAV